MKKRIVGTLMALLLAATVLPPGAISVTSADVTSGLVTTAYAAEHQNHCICGAEHKSIGDHTQDATPETWTGVSSLDEITKDGYYYLTQDVELSSAWGPDYKYNDEYGYGNAVVLCLNGHSISRSSQGYVIDVLKQSTLTLTDCEPNGRKGTITHDADNTGWGMYVFNGTFNMYGGTITGNTSETGGGVYVESGETFNMYGGTISGNTTDYGGGVYVNAYNDESGVFNMYGGAISGNTASNKGGGVFVESGATFTMSGTASITKNTAGKTDGYGFGGGVYSLGTFNLSGGAITENTANCTNFTNQLGGGVMAAGGKLNLSGNPVVKNNIGKDTDNVRVDGATMEVTAALTEGAEIVLNSLKDPTINPTDKSGVWYMWNETTKTLTAPVGGSGGETGGETTEHKHCVCGGTLNAAGHTHDANVTWTGVAALSEITTAGNYYLKNDITLENTWNVPAAGVVLCLNGKTVTAKKDGIIVPANSTFTLTDCKPDGKDGCISGNGWMGVTIRGGGSFILYAGKIEKFHTGLEVLEKGTFTMHGGTIADNNASGVVVQDGGNAVISGGTITGNYVGATLNGETLTVDGNAVITGNSSAGIDDYGTLIIGGNANITGNGGNWQSCNVNLTNEPEKEPVPITVREDFRGTVGVTGGVYVNDSTQVIARVGETRNGVISSDDATMTISDEGKLVKRGTTDVAVTGVTLDKSTASVEVNKTVQLTAAVTPDNATNQAVTWRSGDETVATVSANGVVTGVKEGTATITVTTVDGNFTATCEVTVTAAQTGHVHVKGERTYDENGHWFKCTGCNEKLDVGAHVYDNDTDTTCNTCGYVRTISGGGESGGDTPTPPAPTPEAPRYYYNGGSGSTGAGGLSAVQNDPNGKSATDYSGGIYGLLFRTNAALSAFRGVQVDGVTIDAANYSVEGNEVYLKAVYLQTLASGKHTLTVLSGEGDMTAAFTVGGEVSAPKTADAGALAYLGLALSSYVGTALVTRRKKEF